MATNKVAELRVEFTAGTAKFIDGTGKVITTLDTLKKKVVESENTHSKAWSKAGAAFVDYGGKFVAGSARIASSIAKTTLALTTFGAAAVAYGAFKGLSALGNAADQVDRLGKASARLGTTIEDMSAFKFSADQAGIAFETFEAMGSKALRNVAKMVAAGKTSLKLGDVRVDLTDTAGRVKGLTELFPDFAKAISSARGQAEQLRLSEQIFGRAGADQFVQLLKESGDYLKAMNQQRQVGQRLGVIFSQRDFEIARDYGDALQRIRYAFLGIKVAVLREVGPALTEFADSAAYRLASIPRLAGSAMGLVNASGSAKLTDAQRRLALDSFGELQSATVNVLKTSATETGKIIGVSFIEAVTAGMKLLGPSISDLFRDNVGPILNHIPGVSIDPSLSQQLVGMKARGPAARSELLSAQAQRAGLLAGDYDKTLHANDPNNLLAQTMKRQLIDEASSNIQRLSHEIDTWKESIAKLEDQVSAEKTKNAREFAESFAQSFDATSRTIDIAKSKIQDAFVRLDVAAKNSRDLYENLVPPESASRSQGPTIIDFVKNQWDGLISWGQHTLTRVQSLMPKIRQAVVEAQFVSADLEGRRLSAIGSSGADEFNLKTRQARELMDFQTKYPMLIAQLKQVQAAERSQLSRQQMDSFNQAYDERQLAANSLRVQYLPSEGIKERRKIFDAQAREFPKIITPQVRAEFNKELFELELAADRTFGGKMTNAIYGWRDNVTDVFVELRRTGKFNFDSLADSFADMITRMAAQELIVTPLFQGILGAVRGIDFGGTSISGIRQAGINAGGFSAGDLAGARAGGGDVMSGKTYVVGEQGPELFTASSDGYVFPHGAAVAVPSSAGVNVQVIDQRGGGAPVQVEQGQGANGERLIRVLIRDEGAKALSEGAWDSPMRGAYGINRKPGR
jgi:outer membrane murein-binding lipoprotein Lpp